VAGYWATRQESRYYRAVLRLAKKYAASAQSMLDVGTGPCPYPEWFTWIPRKVLVDKREGPAAPGTERICADFMTLDMDEAFDLVTCLQVLEHLPDPEKMAARLLKQGKAVIVSVPYMWPKEACRFHVQDPVSEKKLLSWFGVPATETLKVTEPGTNVTRLIAVFVL